MCLVAIDLKRERCAIVVFVACPNALIEQIFFMYKKSNSTQLGGAYIQSRSIQNKMQVGKNGARVPRVSRVSRYREFLKIAVLISTIQPL